MPELPDVEAFRAMAQHEFRGDTVARVVVPDPASLEDTTPATVQRRLKERSLSGTSRYGKYLFLDFGENDVLVMHFGPAGALRRVSSGEEEPSYIRFRIDFAKGNSLAYINRRRIGRVRLVDNEAAFIKQAKLGPDVLDPAFGVEDCGKILAGRKQPIKAVLIDQSKMAGIGNTWSDEILFQARVHPSVPAGSVSADQCRALFDAMRDVLRKAIELDPTADDFLERLPRAFLLPHRHPGGHCPRCGTALKRLAIAGHTSTYCPHCQR